jgi:hypothetical protein
MRSSTSSNPPHEPATKRSFDLASDPQIGTILANDNDNGVRSRARRGATERGVT